MAAKNKYCFDRRCLCANCKGYCPMCEHTVSLQCDTGRKDCEYYEMMDYNDYLKQEGYEDSQINREEFYFETEDEIKDT